MKKKRLQAVTITLKKNKKWLQALPTLLGNSNKGCQDLGERSQAVPPA